MTLSQVLQGICHQPFAKDKGVTTLTRDSRQVVTGTLFFCIKGVNIDGHDYAEKALEKGAAGVVVERDLGIKRQILVESTTYAYGIAAGNYYGNPSKSLKLIGVTGTNGKTTTAYIVKAILEYAGKKVGLIGTVENKIGSISLQAHHTTPDPLELHSLFSRMVKAECEYVVMEVSSHGLSQQRLAGCHFLVGAFTNLTQDHLDYHGTMEAYFQAKKQLFNMTDLGVANGEDAYARRIMKETDLSFSSFSSSDSKASYWAEEIVFSQKGSEFIFCSANEKQKTSFIQPGRFSVENALCAGAICAAAGLSLTQIAQGISSLDSIPGRFENIKTDKDFTVIRDFAHSADGLKSLLSTVKGLATGRVVVLFGCAGERDRSKRKEMAKIVAQYADYVIMTSDNPRQETVEQILNDALPGLEGSSTQYKIYQNRFDALLWALSHAQSDDFLILAGKGHEDYQVLSYGSINFNEKELVPEILKRLDKQEKIPQQEG